MTEIIVLTRAELTDVINTAARQAAAAVMSHAARATSVATAGDGELWTANQVAEYLHVSPHTITYGWADKRGFPERIALGYGKKNRTSRWKAAEIRAWAERQTQ